MGCLKSPAHPKYANLLRSKYPDKTIRNAHVFRSGVKEFARLGYIELVTPKPEFLMGFRPFSSAP